MILRTHFLCILTLFTMTATRASAQLDFGGWNSTPGVAIMPYTACPGFRNFIGVKVINDVSTSEKSVECADIQSLDDVYDQVNIISPYELLMPELTVQNTPLPSVEDYRFAFIRVQLGMNLNIPGQKEAAIQQFAHELGHHIFYSYAYTVLAKSPEKLYVEAGEMVGLYHGSVKKARESIDSAAIYDSVTFTSFQSLLGPFEERFGNQETALFDEISEEYQELFSDVVAALVFNDADVMVNAMQPFMAQIHPEDQKLIGYRAFTKNNPITLDTAKFPHYQYAPIRADMWSQWITPRLADKKALLKELFDIFIGEAKRRVAAGEKSRTTKNDLQKMADNKKNVRALSEKLGLIKK